MPRFGQFEVERMIARRALGDAFVGVGPSGPVIIRTRTPDPELRGRAWAEREVHAFLEAAESQSILAASSEGWAHVEGSGVTDDGAWAAVRRYGRSVERIAVQRVDPIDAPGLAHLVENVVLALRDMHDGAGRPHGNLKPSNVLVSGRVADRVMGAQVVLTDPLPPSRVRQDEDRARDFRAVGELVHLVVTRRVFTPGSAWPFAAGPEWRALGSSGRGWFELANALLDPRMASSPPPIETILMRLPGGAKSTAASQAIASTLSGSWGAASASSLSSESALETWDAAARSHAHEVSRKRRPRLIIIGVVGIAAVGGAVWAIRAQPWQPQQNATGGGSSRFAAPELVESELLSARDVLVAAEGQTLDVGVLRSRIEGVAGSGDRVSEEALGALRSAAAEVFRQVVDPRGEADTKGRAAINRAAGYAAQAAEKGLTDDGRALSEAAASLQGLVDQLPKGEWNPQVAASAQKPAREIVAQASAIEALVGTTITRLAATSEADSAEVRDVRASAEAVIALLDAGYLPSEATPEGSTVQERADAVAKLPGFERAQASVTEVGAMRAALAAVEKATQQRGADAARIASEGGTLAQRLAAWAGVVAGSDSWPASADDVTEFARIAADMLESTGIIEPEARKARLAAGIQSDIERVVIAAAERGSGDAAMLRAILASLNDVGVTEEALPAKARFNALLLDAKEDAGQTDEAARARLSQFVKDARAIDGLPREAETSVMAIEALLAAPVSTAPDITKAGPAAAGWTAAPSGDGSMVRFTKGRMSIEFARISQAGATASYLMATEVPVELFMDVLADHPQGKEVVKLLPTDASKGPRTWVHAPNQVGQIRLPTDTQTDRTGWMPQFGKVQGGNAIAPALATQKPGLGMPINRVSPAAAVAFARLVGCRLPTSDEFAKGLQVSGESGTPNLLDATWKQQRDHITATNKEPAFEEMEVFWPGRPARVLFTSLSPAVGSNDGILFFGPVGSGSGGVIKNLIGNVAELVYDDPAAAEKVTGPADVRSALDFATVKVVGGSALTPPDIDVRAPRRVDEAVRSRFADAAFSDVGFRLAFSAGSGGGGLAERARGVVRSLALIP